LFLPPELGDQGGWCVSSKRGRMNRTQDNKAYADHSYQSSLECTNICIPMG
jgi:hypothetical protein